MHLSEKELDLIDSYLTGNVTDQEKVEIEVRIKTDKDFAMKLEEMKLINTGIKQDVLTNKFEFLQELEKANPKESIKQKDGASMSTMMKLLVAILLIGVSLIIYNWWSNHQAETQRMDALYAQHFDPPPSPIRINRSSTDSIPHSELKIRAYNLYTIKEYKLAAPLLEQVYQEENDTLSLYYSGFAFLGARDKMRTTLIIAKLKTLNFDELEIQELISQSEKLRD